MVQNRKWCSSGYGAVLEDCVTNLLTLYNVTPITLLDVNFISPEDV